jgi:hypothetical protein
MVRLYPLISRNHLLLLLTIITPCLPTQSEGAVDPESLRQEAQASATDVAIIEVAAKSASGQPPGTVIELDAVVIEVKRSASTLEPGQAIHIVFNTLPPVDPDFEAGRPGRQPPIPPRAPEVGERVTAFLSARRTADGAGFYVPAAGEWSFERVSSSATQPRPQWLAELIDRMASGPVLNPPQAMAVYRCEYRGQTAYLRPSHCCDIPSVLYDESGAAICNPDGGITGRGDGQCADFSRACTVIWRDPRAESAR